MRTLTEIREMISAPVLESCTPVREVLLAIADHLAKVERYSHQPQAVPSISSFDVLQGQVHLLQSQVQAILRSKKLSDDVAQVRRDQGSRVQVSLRDHFAGQAMIGFLLTMTPEPTDRAVLINCIPAFADLCYAYADAMLESRKESRPEKKDEKRHNPAERCFQCGESWVSSKHSAHQIPADPVYHRLVHAPDFPCVCGAKFNEPVHDPKYGGHPYYMGEHVFEVKVMASSGYHDVCRWCDRPKNSVFHETVRKKNSR